jgi:hypothetical protein
MRSGKIVPSLIALRLGMVLGSGAAGFVLDRVAGRVAGIEVGDVVGSQHCVVESVESGIVHGTVVGTVVGVASGFVAGVASGIVAGMVSGKVLGIVTGSLVWPAAPSGHAEKTIASPRCRAERLMLLRFCSVIIAARAGWRPS